MNIEQISYFANAAALGIVMLAWFVFAWTFFLRKKPSSGTDRVKAPTSIIGIVLQGVGFGIVWAVQRRPFLSPLIDGQYLAGIILAVAAVAVAAVSIWLATSAIRELGKQWSLQARLIEGHKLVTSGVYSIVRHPIYTAMFGMLLATGLVLSHWIAIIIAVIIFYVGTKIRTGQEERLLQDAFGEEFAEWKAKVPGLIPFIPI